MLFFSPTVFLRSTLEYLRKGEQDGVGLIFPFISACNPEVITAFQGGFLAVVGGWGKIISIIHARTHTLVQAHPHARAATVDYMLAL